ncbi:MAG: hypothetical protein AMJ63_11040 [Myxococcales bacterium SG8_38_1]|nr:MAG: hypothetical protein AMJ63_11040 [Myxococcales bacterium SG8_38_1]
MKTRPRARSTRDQHGIPQIVADDIEGLYWGMGYCHAMDRGLQMLIMRILGHRGGSRKAQRRGPHSLRGLL